MVKILVTGSNGLVGEAFRNVSHVYPEFEFYFADRTDADLREKEDVIDLYERVKPNYVIHTAANVGGISYHLRKPAELFYDNILMNSHMIHCAYLYGVDRFICFSSLCSFSEDEEVIQEYSKSVGSPYFVNYAYGYAKRMLEVQIESYREQYGVSYSVFILTNTYGPHDNWNLEDAHVISGIIHKCYLAKEENTPLTLWGTGTSVREFIFSEDIARCCLDVLKLEEPVNRVILSSGQPNNISEIAHYIKDAMNFSGDIVFNGDESMNGQKSRLCDNSKLLKILPNVKFTPIQDGIASTADWFLNNYPNIRK